METGLFEIQADHLRGTSYGGTPLARPFSTDFSQRAGEIALFGGADSKAVGQESQRLCLRPPYVLREHVGLSNRQ
jgi:hypothetical protein